MMRKLFLGSLAALVGGLGWMGYNAAALVGWGALAGAPGAVSYASLVRQNHELKQANTRLTARHERARRLVRDNRRRVVRKGLGRAGKKLASTGAQMIPFAGIAAVAAVTVDDIQGFCDDIEAARALEREILGSTDASGEAEEGYCRDALRGQVEALAREAWAGLGAAPVEAAGGDAHP